MIIYLIIIVLEFLIILWLLGEDPKVEKIDENFEFDYETEPYDNPEEYDFSEYIDDDM